MWRLLDEQLLPCWLYSFHFMPCWTVHPKHIWRLSVHKLCCWSDVNLWLYMHQLLGWIRLRRGWGLHQVPCRPVSYPWHHNLQCLPAGLLRARRRRLHTVRGWYLYCQHLRSMPTLQPWTVQPCLRHRLRSLRCPHLRPHSRQHRLHRLHPLPCQRHVQLQLRWREQRHVRLVFLKSPFMVCAVCVWRSHTPFSSLLPLCTHSIPLPIRSVSSIPKALSQERYV